MSYEGFERWYCKEGHMEVYDCYDAPWEDNNWKCWCGKGFAFRQCVNQTNGYEGPEPLEILEKKECICATCGNSHLSEPIKYKLPK